MACLLWLALIILCAAASQLSEMFGQSYISSIENQVQNYTEENQVFGNISKANITGTLPSKFDYIIAGGGTAGLTLANRLSALKNVTVAVIEAGGIYETLDPIMRTVPGFCGNYAGWNASASLGKVPVDWNYVTEPQSGLKNQSMFYARGKCLGGSSSRNYMIYHRPTRDACSLFANMTNNHDFEFDNWNAYFYRSTFLPPPHNLPSNATPVYTGDSFSPDGPVRLTLPDYIPSFCTWADVGFQNLGIMRSPTGFCNGNILGSAYVPLTVDPNSKQRQTSESAYLRPVIERKNLFIFCNTTFEKIIFDGKKKATGVSLNTKDGDNVLLNVNKEVILSGGAFNTPQMLMLSGIGPKHELTAKGIDSIVDSPNVAKNLMDHILFGPTYATSLNTETKLTSDPKYYQEVIDEYVQNRTGPLTGISDPLIGFQRIDSADLSSEFLDQYLEVFPEDWPHIEYAAAATWFGDWANPSIGPSNGTQYASIQSALVSPLSRGEVKIASNSVWEKPVIDPRFLTHPADQALAVASYKLTRRIINSISEVIEYEAYPGEEFKSDEQIFEIIKESVNTVWHASCTARMGTNISNGVIDGHTRVFGVEGVRVVDSSSFPILPAGHPIGAIYALAELVSDYVLYGDEELNPSNSSISTIPCRNFSGRETSTNSSPMIANMANTVTYMNNIAVIIAFICFFLS